MYVSLSAESEVNSRRDEMQSAAFRPVETGIK